jgi:hypothetical protein
MGFRKLENAKQKLQFFSQSVKRCAEIGGTQAGKPHFELLKAQKYSSRYIKREKPDSTSIRTQKF